VNNYRQTILITIIITWAAWWWGKLYVTNRGSEVSFSEQTTLQAGAHWGRASAHTGFAAAAGGNDSELMGCSSSKQGQ
jgi:hypothetical protein